MRRRWVFVIATGIAVVSAVASAIAVYSVHFAGWLLLRAAAMHGTPAPLTRTENAGVVAALVVAFLGTFALTAAALTTVAFVAYRLRAPSKPVLVWVVQIMLGCELAMILGGWVIERFVTGLFELPEGAALAGMAVAIGLAGWATIARSPAAWSTLVLGVAAIFLLELIPGVWVLRLAAFTPGAFENPLHLLAYVLGVNFRALAWLVVLIAVSRSRSVSWYLRRPNEGAPTVV